MTSIFLIICKAFSLGSILAGDEWRRSPEDKTGIAVKRPGPA